MWAKCCTITHYAMTIRTYHSYNSINLTQQNYKTYFIITNEMQIIYQKPVQNISQNLCSISFHVSAVAASKSAV